MVIPTDQTVFGPRGNCTAACLASIFELSIDEVVDLYQVDTDEPLPDWWSHLRDWLSTFGVEPLLLEGHQSLQDTWAIAGGPGPRGMDHSVVWRNREIVHDPHPSRDGLLSIDDYMFFIAKNPISFVRRK